MIDYLDVSAGDPNRAALLTRLINQNSANQMATGQFDSLNRRAAGAMGVSPRPALAPAASRGPFPAMSLPSGASYPGLPVSGTSSYFNIPRVTAQVVGGVPSPMPSTSTPVSDLTRSYLQARQSELAQPTSPSVVTSA